MRAIARMVWDCGVCHINWSSKEEAEWCCSQECEQATAHFHAQEEVKAEQKIVNEFPGMTY